MFELEDSLEWYDKLADVQTEGRHCRFLQYDSGREVAMTTGTLSSTELSWSLSVPQRFTIAIADLVNHWNATEVSHEQFF